MIKQSLFTAFVKLENELGSFNAKPFIGSGVVGNRRQNTKHVFNHFNARH